MDPKRIVVIGTGTQRSTIAAALIAAGAEFVQIGNYPSPEITGVWLDECPAASCDECPAASCDECPERGDCSAEENARRSTIVKK
jgi:hypothetical protein